MSTIAKAICSAALLVAMAAAQNQVPAFTFVETNLDGFNADIKETGDVRIDKEGDKLKLVADLRRLKGGKYSLSIHEKGDCGDNSKAAGGVMKGGNLGTVTAEKDGTAHMERLLTGLSLLEGPNAVGGKAIVLGQDGKPLACGTLLPPTIPPPMPPAM
jgi:Cu/Zn superoxide dismutase